MVAPQVVIDTSVAFKLFVGYGETGLDQAAALLRAHREKELSLIAPATLPIEIANSLRYLLPDREDVLGFLADLESLHIELFATDFDLVNRAATRALETEMGVYDALFLALAEERGCPLVTADRKAFRAVESPIEIRIL
jgi:predicted nucleic acid-binding protein